MNSRRSSRSPGLAQVVLLGLVTLGVSLSTAETMASPTTPEVGDSLRLDQTGATTVLAWSGDVMPGPFNVYRGGRTPDGKIAYGCAIAEVAGTQAEDATAPLPGRVWYFVVSRLDATGESVLTRNNAGVAVLNPYPCPAPPPDADGDGYFDAIDVCPQDADPLQADGDRDGDGDACDNCPAVPNASQADSDGDALGDACDACPIDAQNDADSDGFCGNVDNCPTVPNPGQANADGDGLGDACDACPIDAQNDADSDGRCGNVDNCPSVSNPGQADADGDGLGDACDTCPGDSLNDPDGDGICGNVDNCPMASNPGQADADGDGVGDACDFPVITVAPAPLVFGEVSVGATEYRILTIGNAGTDPLHVSAMNVTGAGFQVFPPTTFTILPGGAARTVQVGFTPRSAGAASGTVVVQSNAPAAPSKVVGLSATGALPPGPPELETLPALEFEPVAELDSASKLLAIRNAGIGPLTIDSAVITPAIVGDPSFSATPLIGDFPFNINPGATRSLVVHFDPPAGAAGSTRRAVLKITSNDPDNDPDEGTVQIALSGTVTAPQPRVNVPIVDARVGPSPYDLITSGTCAGVGGEVVFGADSSAADTFRVVLTDGTGGTSETGGQPCPEGPATVPFGGVAACGLADGVISVSVVVTRDGDDLPAYAGRSAVKNTSALPPPVLDPVPAVTLLSTVQICGLSQANTTVRITGGASPVAISLGAGTTAFCLDVPLRLNRENELIASAVDDSTAEAPVAPAPPVRITQVSPSEIAIAEVTTTPLGEEEIAQLVASGVINLDDPANYNVSIFTIVFTVGSYPVVFSTVVVEPVNNECPDCVEGGGGGGGTGGTGSGGFGWYPNGFGGFGGEGGNFLGSGGAAFDGEGCQLACVIGWTTTVSCPNPEDCPTGPTIAGIIVIDGRIRTLKEMFQVTVALFNASSSFDLSDVKARIALPSGLTALAAGLGTDVAGASTELAQTALEIGDIAPGGTGTGQFIIRGDAIGTHPVDVAYDGFVTGASIPDPIPFSGAAGTTVRVEGPPKMGVVVRHPRNDSGPDVQAGEVYPLVVEITNLSARPALYTSLDLFVGGNSQLVDENDQPLPDSHDARALGNIQPGATVASTFRVRSLAQGELIACQAAASDNISLSIDTGPEGSPCGIASMIDANFQPLPADAPPTVVAFSPTNAAADVPPTTSVFATLTPRTACLDPDTWTNVETAPIGGNPANGFAITAADLVDSGSFYLEKLDPFGNPVGHVPTDLDVAHPAAGGTTIATLRLGLDDPLSQAFLEENTTYRATLVGEDAGGMAVCSQASPANKMAQTFRWTFTTAQACESAPAPTVTMSRPVDGSMDRPLNQSIVLDFSRRMSDDSFFFDPGSLALSSIGFYKDATLVGGDLSGGTPLAGAATLSNANRRLTFTPAPILPGDTTIHVRLTDALHDTCGAPLVTPPGGPQIFSFRTTPPDAVPPAVPVVNPVPPLTSRNNLIVSGIAEPNSTVTITGGLLPASGTVPESGLFSVSVPLAPNQTNALAVVAADASGNVSAPPVTADLDGRPLAVFYDASAPAVIALVPAAGATEVPLLTSVAVTFSEPIQPGTVNSLNFALARNGQAVGGTFALAGDSGFTFTPAAPLAGAETYTATLRAGGVRDLAGNGLQVPVSATFMTTHRLIGVVGGSKTLALGQTASLQVLVAPDAAPSGGLPLTVTSSDPALVEVLTPTATVPVGAFTTTFEIRAAADQVGSATVTVGNPGYAPDSVVVTVTAGLEIIPPAIEIVSGQTGTLDVRLVSGGAPYPAAAGGVPVALNSSDPQCVGIGPSLLVAEGQIFGSTTLTNGGAASLPCTAMVTASAAPFGADAVAVTVSPSVPPIGSIGVGDAYVGAGLQTAYTLFLSTASHGGVTLQMTSGDSSVLRLAPDPLSPGTSTLTVGIPNGVSSATIFLQGVAGATGTVGLTATTPKFTTGSATVTVNPVRLELVYLPAETRTLATNTAFNVYTEVQYSAGCPGCWTIQNVSAGAGPLTVAVTSSDPGVSGLTTGTQTNTSPVTVTIPINQYYSSDTLQLDPGGGGTTTIEASAPNFAVAPPVTVTVNQPTITLYDALVGGGLHMVASGNLGEVVPGGATVHVATDNPSLFKVAKLVTEAGSDFVDIAVPNGTTGFTYYVEGQPGATGTGTATATSPGFSPGTATINVNPVRLELIYLPAETRTLSANTAFNVRTEVQTDTGCPTCWTTRWVSPGAGPLTVTVTSSNLAVAGLTTATQTSTSSVTVTIPPGQDYTSDTLQFDPGSSGTTTIEASAPNFAAAPAVTVTVSPPPITLSDAIVGGGLQVNVTGYLGEPGHGGVTVHLASGAPSLFKVAKLATDPGSDFVDIAVPDGTTFFTYFLQGEPGATGTGTVTATSPLFATGSATVSVNPVRLELSGVPTVTTTLAANTAFNVYTEVQYSAGCPGCWTIQNVSAGAGPLTVAVTSSDAAVAGLTTATQTNTSPVTVTIPINQYFSTLQLDPGSGGTTTVEASAPNFAVAPPVTVTVNQPTITLYDALVGGGLHMVASGNLGEVVPGGATVHVVSDNPSLFKVAKLVTEAGSDFVDIAVPNGTTGFTYYVEGQPGATGTGTATATSPGFSPGTATINVNPVRLELIYLPAETRTLSANTAFNVRTEVQYSAGCPGCWTPQNVSAGAGPLTVTVTSSDPAVAGLTTATQTSTSSVTVTIPPGQDYTSDTLQFDPGSSGTTTIEASAPNFAAAPAVTVTVSPPPITLSDAIVGGGLQVNVTGYLGEPVHGGVTVHLASGASSLFKVAKLATDPGSDFVDIAVPDGTTFFTYFLQGEPGATGTGTVTATSPLFATGSATVSVNPVRLELSGVPTVTTTLAANTAFNVYTEVNVGCLYSWCWPIQSVSAGAGPLTVAVTSSNPAVAGLTTGTQTSTSPVTVTIPINQYFSTLQLDPGSGGTTTVEASAPNFASAPPVTVTVNQPTITLYDALVGGGLQANATGYLSEAGHGGVTVRVSSLNPALARVAKLATDVGTSFIDIVVPDGTNSFGYFVQGVSGTTGTGTVTATSPLFTGGTATISVNPVRLSLQGLPATTTAQAANLPFFVQTEMQYNTGCAGCWTQQNVSSGAGPLMVTVTSSNPAVAGLTTLAQTTSPVTVQIPANAGTSPGTLASGGVELDPVAPGQVTVAASASGFTAASQSVTVNP